MNTIYILQSETGFILTDDNGVDHGTADNIAEAIQIARDSIALGLATRFCVDE